MIDYPRIGEGIKMIREKELKISREEFAEELDISNLTVTRLENGIRKVNNIEIYYKISLLTGYTIDELIRVEQQKNDSLIKRITNLLSHLSNSELEYAYSNIKNFTKFIKKERGCMQNE